MYFSELKLAEKNGKELYIAVTENKYNRYELIHKWLPSDTYDETINFYAHLCSQAKTYILAAFEREFENDLPSNDEESPLYGEDLIRCIFMIDFTNAMQHNKSYSGAERTKFSIIYNNEQYMLKFPTKER